MGEKLVRCRKLEDILELPLSLDVGQTVKKCLGQRVYFDHHGSCVLGTLIGVDKDGDNMWYVINKDGKELCVPTHQSLTRM